LFDRSSLTSSNYDDDQKKMTGGRNGYGAKLANIYSTEFSKLHTVHVFSTNANIASLDSRRDRGQEYAEKVQTGVLGQHEQEGRAKGLSLPNLHGR
jgi:DNA gyrase/topoisomerase IV subunit B